MNCESPASSAISSLSSIQNLKKNRKKGELNEWKPKYPIIIRMKMFINNVNKMFKVLDICIYYY